MRRWPIALGFCLVFIALAAIFLASVLARVIKDVPSSKNGFASNCPFTGNTCLYFQTNGTVNLKGTDAKGNPITVSATLSDWGNTDANGNHVSNVVLDVMLQGSDTTLNLQRFIMSGVQPTPTYVSCQLSSPAIACAWAPLPDTANLQEPTPIAGSDGKNTQWDLGSTTHVDQFVDIKICTPADASCPGTVSGLGEAILVVDGSFASDNLSLNASNYLAIVSDGNGNVFNLGGLTPPQTALAANNNTQATATTISGANFTDSVDTSQLSPSEDSTGTMQVPQGFVLPPSPSCNPPGVNSSNPDTRVFRTAWYSYVPPSNGSVTVSTANSHYDSLVYVLTGSTEIACNDDQSNALLQAAISTPIPVSAGVTYDIVVVQTPPEQTPDPNNAGATIGYPLSTDGTLDFNFKFTAAAPTASLSPTTLPFGGQLINTSSSAQSVSLTNNGPGVLSVSNIAVSSGSGFSQTNNCPASLAAGTSCAINVTFNPTSTGTVNGTLTVTDSASISPQVATLSGSGTDFQASASSFSSSTISPGQSTTATITVSPTGAFSPTVALSCGITPVTSIPPSCGLSPTSVPNGSGTSTLTISTVAPTTSLKAPSAVDFRLWYALLFPIGLAFVSSGKLKFRSRQSGLFARIVGLMLISVAMIECGGNPAPPPVTPHGGTTSGAYTATVTATGGGGSRITTLPLTVQ